MTTSLHRAHVLRALRHAGRRGVPMLRLREMLGGQSAEPVLAELRERGHRVTRCSDETGLVRAYMFESDRDAR